MGERFQPRVGSLFAGLGADCHHTCVSLLSRLREVTSPALPELVLKSPELLNVQLLQPDQLVPHRPHHLLKDKSPTHN